MEKNKISFKLIFTFILTAFVIILFTSALFSFYMIKTQSILLKNFISSNAETLARALADSSEYGVISSSKEVLFHLTNNTIKQDNVLYSVVYDVAGNTLALQAKTYNTREHVESTPVEADTIKSLADREIQKNMYTILNVGNIMDILVPVKTWEAVANPKEQSMRYNLPAEEQIVGAVRIGVDCSSINFYIKFLMKSLVIITLVIVSIGVFFAFFISKMLIKSIRKEMLLESKQ